MVGRYGPDQLFIGLFVLSIVVNLVAGITGVSYLSILSWLIIIYALFRFMSRNIYKRRHENDVFLRYWTPFSGWFKKRIHRIKDGKTHRFFKCPGCGNTLRVPKGKGKINITCPKCGARFEKKT
jgi:ribosomal protein S27E